MRTAARESSGSRRTRPRHRSRRADGSQALPSCVVSSAPRVPGTGETPRSPRQAGLRTFLQAHRRRALPRSHGPAKTSSSERDCLSGINRTSHKTHCLVYGTASSGEAVHLLPWCSNHGCRSSGSAWNRARDRARRHRDVRDHDRLHRTWRDGRADLRQPAAQVGCRVRGFDLRPAPLARLAAAGLEEGALRRGRGAGRRRGVPVAARRTGARRDRRAAAERDAAWRRPGRPVHRLRSISPGSSVRGSPPAPSRMPTRRSPARASLRSVASSA